VFVEGVRLGIAMLDGGNTQVQKSLYDRVVAGTADNFFKVRWPTVPSGPRRGHG